MTLTLADLEALREKAEKATPGPWAAFSVGKVCDVHKIVWGKMRPVVQWGGFDASDYGNSGRAQSHRNARYIAAANPEVIKALIDLAGRGLAAEDAVKREREACAKCAAAETLTGAIPIGLSNRDIVVAKASARATTKSIAAAIRSQT